MLCYAMLYYTTLFRVSRRDLARRCAAGEPARRELHKSLEPRHGIAHYVILQYRYLDVIHIVLYHDIYIYIYVLYIYTGYSVIKAIYIRTWSEQVVKNKVHVPNTLVNTTVIVWNLKCMYPNMVKLTVNKYIVLFSCSKGVRSVPDKLARVITWNTHGECQHLRRENMVGVKMVLAESVQFKHGIYSSCGINVHHEGIMLEPCLLQPCFHVAGETLRFKESHNN